MRFLLVFAQCIVRERRGELTSPQPLACVMVHHSSVLNCKNQNLVPRNSENDVIGAYAQFAIPAKRSAKRFSESLRSNGQFFLNCRFDFRAPSRCNLWYIFPNNPLVVFNGKVQSHARRWEIKRAFAVSRLRAIASHTSSSSTSSASRIRWAAFVAGGIASRSATRARTRSTSGGMVTFILVFVVGIKKV